MFRVGVTGGIGSGKTTVTDMFGDLGIDVVDADVVARDIVRPNSACLQEITSHYGASILLDNGELDRTALRKIIFTDDNERLWLERLTHPVIRSEILTRLDNAACAYVILSSPLLFETNQTKLVDRIAVVDVPESMQLQRASHRDGADVARIQSIMDKQLSRTDRLHRADDVIDNSQSLLNTQEQVTALHARYMNH